MIKLPSNCDGEDCTKCSSEYCETHFSGSCDCDIAERHIIRYTKVLVQYEGWIRKNVPKDCSGMCEGITIRMAIDFPELKRVRGYYMDRPHWWCVTPDGVIIDPTKAQFPVGGSYVPY